MGKKILKGTFIGGFVAWLWLVISWTFLPWHCGVLQKFSNETEVASVIKNNCLHDGIYFLPYFCEGETTPQLKEAFEKGPVIFAAIQRYGSSMRSVVPYIFSIILQWIGAFIIFLVLLQARRLHYGSKVAMTTLIGLIIGILGAFPNWIWWGFPFPYAFVKLCDATIAWFLAGLFMAAFATGSHPPSEPQSVKEGESAPKEEERNPWEFP